MMKKYLFFLPALIVALLFTGCDEKKRLAKEVNGAWASSPEMLKSYGATTSVIRMMEFVQTPGQAGGTLIMSGLVSVNSALPANDELVTPVSFTASGVATISGDWTAIDDDEIAVFLDPNTVKIDVDPAGVVLDYNVMTTESAPDTASVKPAMAEIVKNEIRQSVVSQFLDTKKIDDIKVKGNLMSCEIGKLELMLRRQNIQ